MRRVAWQARRAGTCIAVICLADSLHHLHAQSFLADLQRAKQGLCVEVPTATVVFVMASPTNAGSGTGSGGPRLIGLVLPAVG